MENQDSLTPTQYGKMVGMFPDPPHNPLPTGGYMDAGFDWVVHQAEGGNSTYEYVMGMIEDLSDEDYTDFCYEMDIDPEDMEELSSFVMRNYDSNPVMGFLKDRGMVKGYQAEARPISDDDELLAVYDDGGQMRGFIEMEDDEEEDAVEIDISDEEMNEIAEIKLGAESKSMFGKDKNGKMYARKRNGEIITHNADSEESDLDYIRKLTDSFMSKNPTIIGEYGPFGYYKLYEHPVRGDTDFLYFYTPAMGGLVVNSALMHKDQMNDKDAAIVSNNLVKLLKQDNLYHTDIFGGDNLNTDGLYEGTQDVYFAETTMTVEHKDGHRYSETDPVHGERGEIIGHVSEITDEKDTPYKKIHDAEFESDPMWVRVETQKIGNNEGRLDSEIAGRVTGYFTSEFAALKDARKRLAQYEAIPQRFMNDLTKSKTKITVISHLQKNTVNKIEYTLTERHGAESFAAEKEKRSKYMEFIYDEEEDAVEIDISDEEMNEIAEIKLGAETFESEWVVEAVQQNLNDKDFVNYAYKVLIGGDAKTFEEKSMAIAETMNQNANNDDFTSFVESELFSAEFSAQGKQYPFVQDTDFVKPSRDWLSLALGTAAVVIGGGLFLQNRSMFKADGDEMAPVGTGEPSLVAHPSTGDLLPADYEEMIVESTGYAVPIIPVSLDPAFMGSRFHALPTDRTVESNEPGIGAHTDVAMTRDTDFREPEQSMITRFNADGENCECSLLERIKSFFTGKSCCEGKEVKEANSVTGQTPYFGVGFDGKNTQTRVIKETNPISLDPSTAPYIPQNLSGYTGQAYTPPTVYSDMMNIGVSGQNPAFVSTQSSSLQSVHGNLSAGMNQNYTDGSRTMSLSQWSIDYDVSQTSDSEAFAVSRSSGVRTMIRRV